MNTASPSHHVADLPRAQSPGPSAGSGGKPDAAANGLRSRPERGVWA
jgi:hypothetical protein